MKPLPLIALLLSHIPCAKAFSAGDGSTGTLASLIGDDPAGTLASLIGDGHAGTCNGAASMAVPTASSAGNGQSSVLPAVSVFMEKGGCGRAQQGLESYGNFIFSLEDGGHVNVYSWKPLSSEPVGGFELASSHPDNHANNAEFGIERKPGASFPLLYVTNGKVGSDIEWTCFVESISRRGGEWKSELAQTIVLDRCNGWKEKGYTEIFGAPSWLVDREGKSLWIFSAVKRTTLKFTHKKDENLYVATKFRIPSLREGSKVVLGADDIIEQVTFPYDVWFTQAGCMKNGRIFYCFGVGKDSRYPSEIRVYDTATGRISASYSLQNEIPYEMEDIFIRGDWMYVNTNIPVDRGIPPRIYKIRLR